MLIIGIVRSLNLDSIAIYYDRYDWGAIISIMTFDQAIDVSVRGVEPR
jgi:hypothetical protein